MPQLKPISVLGAGSWGTALGILLARHGVETRLWDYNAVSIKAMLKNRYNARYLQKIPFPDPLQPCLELSEALEGVQDILIVVPSHGFVDLVRHIKPLLPSDVRIAWGTKGIAKEGGNRLLHEVVAGELGADIPVAVLAGPTFATEVALGLPTAMAIACQDAGFKKDLALRLHGDNFRVYTSADLIGVELCGAVKNVIAIAAGISDGLAYGANARCALITRGLAEISRLGMALGAKHDTFMGLAGMGDLILTCTDNQSRNRRFGLALGKGVAADRAVQEIGQVVEGRENAATVYQFAQKYSQDMPISEQVYKVLYQGVVAKDAVHSLFAREIKAE